MKRKLLLIVALGLMLSALVLIAAPTQLVFAATAVTVTPSSPNGWFFYDDDYPGGVGTFVAGPASPPAGTGSARMTLTGTARETITTQAYAATRFDKITNLEYYTYGSTSTLQFNIDFDLTDADNTTWMGRLVYTPSGGVPVGSWTKWSPMTGTWWTTTGAGKAVVGNVGGNSVCPVSCTWAQVLSNYPNAGIRLYDGGIHIKAGGPAPGFDGNVDMFTIGVSSNDTTFDFEDGSTSLVFVPDNAKVGVGGTTFIGININNVTNLYGYQFKVSYNSSLASAAAWFGDSPNPKRPVGFPQFYFFVTNGDGIPIAWNATCSGGTCQFAVSHVAPQAPVSGSGPVAWIGLTGITPGTFTMNFSDDILSDIDGGGITHTTNTATITVYGTTTVSGSVKLQGRATPIDAGAVTLTDLGGNFPPLTANFDPGTGAYSFPTVPVMPGGSNYQFDAAHSLYLGNRQTQTLSDGVPYSAPLTTLRGGDANNDGTISISDLSCIGGAFGGAPTVCGATGSSDINKDLTVNILDLVLGGGNYGLSTPQGW